MKTIQKQLIFLLILFLITGLGSYAQSINEDFSGVTISGTSFTTTSGLTLSSDKTFSIFNITISSNGVTFGSPSPEIDINNSSNYVQIAATDNTKIFNGISFDLWYNDGFGGDKTIDCKSYDSSDNLIETQSKASNVIAKNFIFTGSIAKIKCNAPLNFDDVLIVDNIQTELVSTLNTAPTFTSTAVTSIDENQTYSYSITTNDVDNDAVTLTAPTLPTWLSLNTNYVVSTLAGSGTHAFADGTGTAAQFSWPHGIAIDASGIIYVAEEGNHRIRKITPSGVVTTLAGSGTAGFADGTGSAAQFNGPNGVAVDGSGNVYVADLSNNRIRKITAAGVVTTLAGSGAQGSANGTGTAAQFLFPRDVAVDGSGNVYVADYFNDLIRKITPAGVVSTLAGSTRGYTDATGTAAMFNLPQSVAVDGLGTVYVADSFNQRIRKITPSGVVTTLAGSGTQGWVDGTGTAAKFRFPSGIALDASGNIYISDLNNHRIRKITAAGVVTTLAGSGVGGFADGVGTAAQFKNPSGIAIDASGLIYVADYNNHRIRKITVEKELTGDTTGQAGTHNVVLNANDGQGGSTNQSFTITVNDTTAPTLSSLSPSDNGTGVLIGSNLVLTFNENIQKGTGNILIKDAADNSTVQTIDVTTSTVSITNAVVTINPTADLLKSKNYYIQIPNTAFTDMSSNAYAGITDTTTWNFATELDTAPVAGTGTALDFDGVNDFVALNSTTFGNFGTADFTIEGWIKTTKDKKRFVLGKRAASGATTPLWNVFINASGTLGFEIKQISSANNGDLTGTTDVGDGNWHHFAVTRTGTTTTVYIDGVQEAQKNPTTNGGGVTNLSNATSFKLGKAFNSTDTFKGQMDEVRVWNVARTLSEIQDNRFKILTGNETNLAALFRLDEGTGTTINDATSNNNDGTLTNMDAATDWLPSTVWQNRTILEDATLVINPEGYDVDGAIGTTTQSSAPSHGALTFAPLTYTPTANFNGSDSFTYQVNSNGLNDTYTINVTVTAVNDVPVASNVTFSGTVKVGQQLTGSYTYTDADNDTESGSTYKWYRSDDGSGTNKAAISGATATTYTLVTADVGKYISFEVTPNDGTAFGTAVESALQVVLNTAPTFTSTAVTSIDENQTYTYSITTNDVDNDAVTLSAPTLPSWLSLGSNASVSTLAGSGTTGFSDGTGTAAQFWSPQSVAVDGSGNVYVADAGNNRIRKITPTGVVSTLAGSTSGFADGTGTLAKFSGPQGITVGSDGNIYVSDTGNNRIRKITPVGVVTTIAGSGVYGFSDATGGLAQFANPRGVAVDASGNVFVGDTDNNKIRKITIAGVVTTLAGSGTYGFADATGSLAQFANPRGLAVDASGNVYVADNENNKIRRITAVGVVTTLAGSTYGFADGTGSSAQFANPRGVTVDASENVYVADSDNHRIRKITTSGIVTTLVGSTFGFADGTGTAARFKNPYGIAIDASDNVYIADTDNHRIRKITVSTFLNGDTTGQAGTHNVVLNANDGQGGSTNQSFTITVNDITAPTLSSLSPADNATGVLIGSNLVITFNENVQKGTGNILIKDAADNSTVQTIDVTTSAVSITNAVVTINPTADLLKSKNYYIQIPATAFTDTSLNAYAGITDTTTWNFASELNIPPSATNVTFTGTVKVAQTLTGSYTYTDTENNTESGSTYKWYRSDDNTGTNKTAISGATATTYTLVATDAHKYISFEVTPKDGTAFGTAVESPLQAVVNSVPTVTSVTFTGTVKVGQQLTGNYTYADADNDTESGSTFKWYRSDDNTGTNKTAISGATATTYTLVTADAHKYISFEVTPKDGTAFGTPVESPLQAVVNSVPTVTSVTFTGTVKVGQQLTGNYTYADADSDT
ncbi:MAG: Ig-like domain-containing protein, partial [Flavobacteriaceae bacterium]|nr:Ig-like domain-containing protein [Flavobacteriaceae bacterium]